MQRKKIGIGLGVGVLVGCIYGVSAKLHAAAAPENVYEDWQGKPEAPFHDGAAMFARVKEAMLTKYVDAGLTEDDVYRAAAAGLLANSDPKLGAWNKLLSPQEYVEMKEDIAKKVSGVGVAIRFDTVGGFAEIIDVIPGTPAADAGVALGDQILKVNGRDFRGGQLRDVVYAIRGKIGSSVTLTMLHAAQIKDLKLTRREVRWNSVDSDITPDHVGILTIHHFAENTDELVKKALGDMAAKKVKGLVIDLRGNGGGLFDQAIATTRLFVPSGQVLVKEVDRKGQTKDVLGSQAPTLGMLPLVVLIDGETMSGAEVMAAALKAGAGATTVGSHSFGKWSVQTLDELPNHYAYKYTVERLLAPDGVDLNGKGVLPDVTVDQPVASTQVSQHLPAGSAARQASDVQLRTGLNLLKLKG